MKKAIVFILLAVIVVGCTLPAVNVFSFEETRTDKPTRFYLKMKNDKDFSIVFTHTIHLTDVVENYRALSDGNIQLVSMQYSDVAIGMPAYAEEGQTLIYEDGLYTLMYNNEKLREFNLYIGAVDYELQLQYEAQRYNLKEQLQKGHSYTFSIERISILEYLKGEKIDEQ